MRRNKVLALILSVLLLGVWSTAVFADVFYGAGNSNTYRYSNFGKITNSGGSWNILKELLVPPDEASTKKGLPEARNFTFLDHQGNARLLIDSAPFIPNNKAIHDTWIFDPLAPLLNWALLWLRPDMTVSATFTGSARTVCISMRSAMRAIVPTTWRLSCRVCSSKST